MKYLVFLFLFLFVACKPSTDKEKMLDSIAFESLQSSIDSLFDSRIKENEPGAALLISYDSEKLIGKGYGLRDTENKLPISPSTNMRMASVSKQFTALCILSLVDQGLLSLDDYIDKFWPYPVFKNITVEHLLNHTSGLADYEIPYFLTEWDKSNIVENKDILEWLSTNPKPSFAVGTNWEYSNTAYLVLALLVEKVSGEEFSNFAKNNVFATAGMKQTNYYNLAKPIEINDRAFCYEKDSLEMWKKVDGYFMNGILGDGAVYTSINDYFEYDQALRNKSILSADIHDNVMFKQSSTVPASNRFIDRFPFLNKGIVSYSMGWFFTDDITMHTGGWYGTRTVVVRERNRPLTITIFMNSDSSFDELIIETYDLVTEYLVSIDGSK
jgi:CubicO group peptidase (beta-lactamase class C family)